MTYDPQKLLPDLRSPEKRFADALLARMDFKSLFPDMMPKLGGLDPVDFGKGGAVTGRFRGPSTEPEMQYLKPAGEFIMPKGRLHRPIPTVDYRLTENRIQAFHLDLKLTDEITGPLKKVVEQMAQMREATMSAAYANALFGAAIKPTKRRDRPVQSRSVRIKVLLASRDPRRRKRGARLALQEFRRVFGEAPANWDGKAGLNFTDTGRYRKD